MNIAFADWRLSVLNIFLIIAGVIMIIASVLITIAVSMQEGTKGGLGALTGDAEERIGKNYGKTIDAQLSKYTKIGLIVMFILSAAVTFISVNVK